MNIAQWTEFKRCECDDETCTKVSRHLEQNGVRLGTVTFYGGAYYAMTQITRLGPHFDLASAMSRVENFAAYEAFTYPTRGNA